MDWPSKVIPKVHYHSSEEMREVENGEAQIVIASPPFTNQSDGNTLDKADYLGFIRRVFAELHRVLVPTGTLVSINTDLRDHACYNRGDTEFDGRVWHKHSDIRRIAEDIGFECFETKIWAKSLKRDMYRYTFAYVQFFRKARACSPPHIQGKPEPEFAPDVWLLEKGTFRRDSRGCVFRDAIHPEIVSRCLKRLTQPGHLVVSPFVGSGTVLAVARLLGRPCVGYEVNTNLKPLIEESVRSPEHFPAYSGLLSKIRRLSSNAQSKQPTTS